MKDLCLKEYFSLFVMLRYVLTFIVTNIAFTLNNKKKTYL